jgi:hypothetical protein
MLQSLLLSFLVVAKAQVYYSSWLSSQINGLSAWGSAFATLNSPSLSVDLAWQGVGDTVTSASLNLANLTIPFDLTTANDDSTGYIGTASFSLSEGQIADLAAGGSRAVFNVYKLVNSVSTLALSGAVVVSSGPAYSVSTTLQSQYVPPAGPSTSCGSGTATVTVNIDSTGLRVTIPQFAFSGFTSPLDAMHLHGPASQCFLGPIIYQYDSSSYPAATSGSVSSVSFAVSSQQANWIRGGMCYAAMHSGGNTGYLTETEGFLLPASGAGSAVPCNTCNAAISASSVQILLLVSLAAISFFSSNMH